MGSSPQTPLSQATFDSTLARHEHADEWIYRFPDEWIDGWLDDWDLGSTRCLSEHRSNNPFIHQSNRMTLDDAQRTKVAGWVREGLKLSEIQNRMAAELGLRLTYMEVRLLVDDLKLVPKDVEPKTPPPPPPPKENAPAAEARPAAADETAPSGGVAVTVDQLARPGAMVSGKVTFSDGQRASWYFDQSGRLALAAEQANYRPAAEDLQQFQLALESELSKLGY